MRNLLATLGAVGGVFFAVALLSGALVDEVTPPVALSVSIARTDARPDLGTGLCRINVSWGLDFVDAAAAESLGLSVSGTGERSGLYPCSLIAALLNNAAGCTLNERFPPGWPEPGLGNRPDCAAPPSVDAGPG